MKILNYSLIILLAILQCKCIFILKIMININGLGNPGKEY